MFLPLHRPDCDPIELAFFRRKALPRQAAQRIVEGFWSAIGRILDTFSATECRNYIKVAEHVPG